MQFMKTPRFYTSLFSLLMLLISLAPHARSEEDFQLSTSDEVVDHYQVDASESYVSTAPMILVAHNGGTSRKHLELRDGSLLVHSKIGKSVLAFTPMQVAFLARFPDAKLSAQDFSFPDADGKVFLVAQAEKRFWDKPVNTYVLTGVSRTARKGLIVVTTDVKGDSGYHVVGVDVLTKAVNFDFVLAGDLVDGGNLLWLSDRYLLKEFKSRKGESCSIIDLKERKLVTYGGARYGGIVVKDNKVLAVGEDGTKELCDLSKLEPN